MEIHRLMTTALFRGIPEKRIQELMCGTPHSIRSYGKGETIFHLMERAQTVGLILEGHVEGQKAFPNGSQVNVSIRGPGSLIGMAAAFAEHPVYPCSVVALEKVQVILFQREDLLSLLQREPLLLERCMREMATAASSLQQRLELFSYSGIAQKIAFWLLSEARSTGTSNIRVPETVTQWALQMHVSRPSLHRELRRLEQDGILHLDLPWIEIRCEEGLQAVLSRERT